MHWGVATALLEQSGDEGLFEFDEAWLPRVAPQLHPRLLVLGNLFRDQLDRYGELEHLADEWAELVERLAGRAEFALNADDPLIADLGRDRELRRRPGVTYFGIEDPSQALPQLQHAHDAKHCRRCGAPYAYERAFVGHLGHYSCPNCGADRPAARRRRDPRRAARHVRAHASRCSTPEGELELRLPLPGVYNVYNALAAMTAAPAAPASALERIRDGLEAMKAVVRASRDDRGRRQTGLDPADQEPGRRQRGASHPATGGKRRDGLDLWIALNDSIADGRDVSWIWDADFELLGGGRPARRLRRHPRAGDGAAPEVRGLARRVRSRSSRRSPGSLDEAVRRAPRPALRPAHLHGPARAAHPADAARPGSRLLGAARMSGRPPAGDAAVTAGREAIAWHDVECGAYAADLDDAGAGLPSAPAARSLELGCGQGA